MTRKVEKKKKRKMAVLQLTVIRKSYPVAMRCNGRRAREKGERNSQRRLTNESLNVLREEEERVVRREAVVFGVAVYQCTNTTTLPH